MIGSGFDIGLCRAQRRLELTDAALRRRGCRFQRLDLLGRFGIRAFQRSDLIGRLGVGGLEGLDLFGGFGVGGFQLGDLAGRFGVGGLEGLDLLGGFGIGGFQLGDLAGRLGVDGLERLDLLRGALGGRLQIGHPGRDGLGLLKFGTDLIEARLGLFQFALQRSGGRLLRRELLLRGRERLVAGSQFVVEQYDGDDGGDQQRQQHDGPDFALAFHGQASSVSDNPTHTSIIT